MAIKIELDIDKIWTGAEWDTTLGEIMRDEIKAVVKSEVKKALRESTDLKKAITALKKKAASKILENLAL